MDNTTAKVLRVLQPQFKVGDEVIVTDINVRRARWCYGGNGKHRVNRWRELYVGRIGVITSINAVDTPLGARYLITLTSPALDEIGNPITILFLRKDEIALYEVERDSQEG